MTQAETQDGSRRMQQLAERFAAIDERIAKAEASAGKLAAVAALQQRQDAIDQRIAALEAKAGIASTSGSQHHKQPRALSADVPLALGTPSGPQQFHCPCIVRFEICGADCVLQHCCHEPPMMAATGTPCTTACRALLHLLLLQPLKVNCMQRPFLTASQPHTASCTRSCAAAACQSSAWHGSQDPTMTSLCRSARSASAPIRFTTCAKPW